MVAGELVLLLLLPPPPQAVMLRALSKASKTEVIFMPISFCPRQMMPPFRAYINQFCKRYKNITYDMVINKAVGVLVLENNQQSN